MNKFEMIWGDIYDIIRLMIKLICNFPNIRKNHKNFKREENKNVLILGNGPSLNHIDIEKLLYQGCQVICVNYFPCKNEDFFKIKPRYLCILDEAILGDIDDARINELNLQLKECLEKVTWKMDIICYWGKRLKINNDNIGYIGLSTISCKIKPLQHLLYTHNLANCGFTNVIAGALFYSVITNARQIYLAGVDNSEFKQFEIDENNDVYVKIEHYYGDEKIKVSDINRGEFYLRLKSYCRMFEEYYVIGKYIEKHSDVKVLNLNPYSFIDVFEKTSEFYF